MLLLCGAVRKGKVSMLMVLPEGVIELPATGTAAEGEFISAGSTRQLSKFDSSPPCIILQAQQKQGMNIILLWFYHVLFKRFLTASFPFCTTFCFPLT